MERISLFEQIWKFLIIPILTDERVFFIPTNWKLIVITLFHTLKTCKAKLLLSHTACKHVPIHTQFSVNMENKY